MQTIVRIIERVGGWNPGLFLKIENALDMVLTIEAIEEGPSGSPTVSVTHYGEQNSDLMRDPEMNSRFETANSIPATKGAIT